MNSKQSAIILALVLLAASVIVAAYADEPPPPPLDPYNWQAWFGPYAPNYSGGGIAIGTYPGARDDYDGVGAMPVQLAPHCVQALFYYQNGVAPGDFPVWMGETGFYPGDVRGPIPAGGSKTWYDIYLLGQDYNSGQVAFAIASSWDNAPRGYTAHLVLDQIPVSANWDGPTDFWIDLSETAGRNVYITLPIATVTDPLLAIQQGTKMHITVYAAQVPEPSSLSFLSLALAGVGIGAVRRRRG